MRVQQPEWKSRSMLLAVAVLLFGFSCGSPSPGGATGGRIAWEHSLDEGLRRAARENRVVMVFFYTEWCGWCRRMDGSTFADEQVQQALTRVVAVRLNAESNGRAEAARFRVQSYPVTVFLDASGGLLARIPGFLPAPAFVEELGDVLKEAATK